MYNAKASRFITNFVSVFYILYEALKKFGQNNCSLNVLSRFKQQS